MVRSLHARLKRKTLTFQLILVNNGSTDETGQRLLKLMEGMPEIEVLNLPENLGYGGGILTGMRNCRAPVVGYLWGDEQVGHHAVIAAYDRLIEEQLDICKARRVVRLDGLERLLITRAYHLIAPLFLSLSYSDIHGCPKLFSRPAWERLQAKSQDWFLDAEIMLKAKKLGLAVGEIDVVAHPRQSGRSNVKWDTLAEFALNLIRYRLGLRGR